MIKNTQQFFNENVEFKKLYFFFIWLSFFFSINLNPNEFDNFNLISKIRLFLPSILILSSFVLIKINYKSLMKIDSLIFIIFISLYFVFNLVNVDNPNTNLFWSLYMFLALFFIVSIAHDQTKFIFKITIFIIVIAFIFYFLLASAKLIFTDARHFYSVFGNNEIYQGIKDPPRSSGLARFALISFIFAYLYFLIINKNKKNYVLLCIICFLSFATIVFQSRTSTFIFFVINILIISIYFKEIIKNKRVLIFILIIPFAINFIYMTSLVISNNNLSDLSNKNILQNKGVAIFKNSIIRSNPPRYNYDKISNDEKKKLDLSIYSSGRSQDWEKTFKIVMVKPFKGYGAQADRIFLNQSVHNAFMYSWLSGGIISAIFILACYVKSLYFFFRFLILNKLKKNLLYSASMFFLIIITLRSLLESSFAIYSIDYLIFISSIYFLKNYKNRFNEKNLLLGK